MENISGDSPMSMKMSPRANIPQAEGS